MTSEEASWMVSMPEFGNLLSPLPAGFVADHFGRKIAILISAPIFLIGWIIILYCKTLLALNIARFIQGLGMGIVYTVVPMYLGEIASPQYRGAVTSVFFCLWWFGFLFEYISGPKLSYMNFTYLSAFTNVIFFFAFIWQPESPYYYLMKKDIVKARASLSWLLNNTEEDTNNKLESMKKCVEEDQKKNVAWNQIVVNEQDRKALIILCLGGFLRQFCGLLPLSSYSTQTLTDAGDYFFISPDNVTVVMGIMMFIGSICSTFTLDLFGRRPLLFVSSSISGICMFLVGTFYLFNSHTKIDVAHLSFVPPVCMIILSAASVLGIFPVSVAYTSELFTSSTRGIASSMFSVYTTILGILAFKFYLTISNYFGRFVNFYIYTGVCLFGALLSRSVMPETKGKSFEQIRIELHEMKFQSDDK